MFASMKARAGRFADSRAYLNSLDAKHVELRMFASGVVSKSAKSLPAQVGPYGPALASTRGGSSVFVSAASYKPTHGGYPDAKP